MLVNGLQQSKVGTLICKPARTSRRRRRQSNELKNPENTVVRSNFPWAGGGNYQEREDI